MEKKQTKQVKKKVTKNASAEKAIKSLSEKKLEQINNSIISGSKSEVVEFVMRFSASKDFKNMIGLLAALQENSQFMKRDNEFETIYNVGVIDGQRLMMQSFVEICTEYWQQLAKVTNLEAVTTRTRQERQRRCS